ncbi:peptidyl-prolyl cis-trans isomerase [Peribacillus deserti]|uniref:peptidylprolyl isomerase n=1 Tax=Peribacillus deserti TaxID=673318 RepID=A0A2N5M907_9BACI|nr:peptidyl-prolyl cis-trans isomerase [Peribacillus deserti]PLT30839.1 peptidylprolyl isomerase [Peribacillus deserti]
MSSKQLWTIITGLILCNIITILFFAANPFNALHSNAETEEVASVGKREITRQEWQAEMESRYGKEVLEDMVNQEVIHQAAKKYKVSVPNQDINREISSMKTMYGSYDANNTDDKQLKQQVQTNLLLTELLTKDAVIPDGEIERYYEQHKDTYALPDAYHVSHILVKTEEEAEKVIKELKDGANFSTLAMEKSIDEFSANQGGDLGFISVESDIIPGSYLKSARGLKTKHWSSPIKVDKGYAVIYLHDRVAGKTYTLKEVKNQIRRQIALEQMDRAVSSQVFWNEFNVDWLYGNNK